ncbi:MAG: YqjK family protein, partial [Aquabacterium sp.]|nr:YqjK family protein [Aquabacterium sp.]
MLFDRRQQALAQRCDELQARSAELRGALARNSQVIQTPLAQADRGLAGLRWLKAHPQWVGIGVAVLVVW